MQNVLIFIFRLKPFPVLDAGHNQTTLEHLSVTLTRKPNLVVPQKLFYSRRQLLKHSELEIISDLDP